jgi:hypothetical protein
VARGTPLVKHLLAWIPMVFIAVGNGVLRVTTFGKVLPELRAHQLSTVTGIVLVGVYVWAVMRLWPPSCAKQAITIGVAWTALTVVFEFSFGRLVMGSSWRHLLDDYDIVHGRVWLVFLAWLVAAPWLVWRFQRHR